MDPVTLLAALALAIVVLLVVDFVLAGGAMTCGVTSGMAAAMSTPWGWLGLLLLLALAAALM